MSLFIVVEGLDGLGKSTLAAALAEVLDAKLVRTPGPLRPYLDGLKDLPGPEAYTLFQADRVLTYHTQIRPALDAGRHVVADRYSLSNYAYQATVVGRERVLQDASNSSPPHLLLFCDGPLELAAYRRSLRAAATVDSQSGALTKYEDPARLAQTKKMYDEALRRHASVFADDLERLDATKTREEVLQDAVAAVVEALLQVDPSALEEAGRIQASLVAYLARQGETVDSQI